MSDDELTVQLASFSDEERIAGMKRFEIIRPAIESDVTLPTIAAETGIGLRTLRRWLKEYQTKGLSGLIRQKRNDRGERRLPADVVNLVQAMALRKPPFSLANAIISAKCSNIRRRLARVCLYQRDPLAKRCSCQALWQRVDSLQEPIG